VSSDKCRPEGLEYRIGELAEASGLTTRTLRFYESQGFIDSNNRRDGEHRRFPPDSISRLNRVRRLKQNGLSIAEIRELFDLERLERIDKDSRRLIAEKYKKKLIDAEIKMDCLLAYISDLKNHIEKLDMVQDSPSCT